MSSNFVLIPGLNPNLLEKEPAWFVQNSAHIEKARRTNSWWQRHTLILEKDQELKPNELFRQLSELNYEKVQTLAAPAEFCVRGDTVQIYPVQATCGYVVEFFGNKIERIRELSLPKIHSAAEKEKRLEKRLKERFLQRLLPGDYVVHLDHGIGYFKRHVKEGKQEYLEIEYAQKDRILVPQEMALKKLSPYIGFGKPTIHRLGGDVWFRTKRKVKEEVEKFARELLAMYARRQITNRPPLSLSGDEFERAFGANFEFELTPDQDQAVQDVLKDLNQPDLMDRVICGDVGFGKTEVAMRGIAKVVFQGKQAALLSPTTILAQQHFETLTARFSQFGIKVALFSRAVSEEKIRAQIELLKTGQIEIAIGTHRLLSEDIEFKNLGLAVIDEEQRFGVKQKERLKNFRGAVDVLSLTATPIPRTLHLALASVWNISNIFSPLPGKKSIHTKVEQYNQKEIVSALKFELERQGQVYYLFNSIKGIAQKALTLKELLPKAKIEIAHARLNTQSLLKIIERFKAREFDVLVATTIIENGLDLPNVNTLIVEKAEKLGLSQAHQIRGRVGRKDTQAYAYFFYSPERLTEDAEKRLHYLERFQELGDGYELSLKDLEIRGAGDVLGRAQSGAVTAVGLNLYSSMLAEAVDNIKTTERLN